jgi:RNA polymerase sigma factor (sigma-70 family)
MLMDESDEFISRFDGQPTRWSMVQRAHGRLPGDGSAARQYLVMRYAPAIRRYVFALTRCQDKADDMTQDVIVRLLRGDFAGADPTLGRFRDLLKTAIRNMTRNVWRQEKSREAKTGPFPEIESPSTAETDSDLDQVWKATVLDHAWQRLEAYQASHSGSVAHCLLKLRVDFPDDDSEQLARRLGEQRQQTFRADQVRQQLHRARVRFAEFVVAEVADGLTSPSHEKIEAELMELGLLEIIRDVLPAGWADP